ncbi:MAG TPA: hypothetical protein PKC68_00765 [Alphaproteobacteria bacterium]|nr:hypothetical protein [Alphaproteobacteria bacterium]
MKKFFYAFFVLFTASSVAFAQTPESRITSNGEILRAWHNDFMSPEKLKSMSDNDLNFVLERSSLLLADIEKYGRQVKSDYVFKFFGIDAMNITQVKAWAENFQKLAKNELASRQSGNDPHKDFLALLKGDKLKIYQTEVIEDSVVFYDGNGKMLETPEDFAKAKYWIFPWTTYSGAIKIWKLQGYVFNPDMTLKQEFYVDGVGDRVPSTTWPKE